MLYRKEIDGMRAIAVLPVIFFHAGIEFFEGGYIGVDIFFVISGYLITSIIMKDKLAGKFSLTNFYERRARRILPALTFVLFVSTITAWIFLSPPDYKSFSKSIVAVSTFSSNILFYLQSGYFAPAAIDTPLLHTWSLAIEEQFYIIFPLLLMALWKINGKALILILCLIALLSLFTSELISTNHANANFYFISSRAWELIFGGLIALTYSKLQFQSLQNKNIFSLLGLVMIIVAIMFFDNETPFPSFYTLLPVIGTVLIIMYGHATTIVGQILSLSFLRNIGLVSYSLYLWHYPVISFLHLKTVGKPSSQAITFFLILLIPLAYFSWRFIERPFRVKTKFTQKQIFTYSMIVTVVFISVGILGFINNGFESRFPQSAFSKTAQSSIKRDACHTEGTNFLPPEKACRYFGEEVTWAILGDSHVTEIGYALAEKLNESNQGLLHLSFSDCPPALLFETNLPGCSKWLKDSIDYLINEKSIKNVFIGFRHSFHLYGNHSQYYPEIPNLDPRRIMVQQYRTTRKAAEELYWKSFKEIIFRLNNSGKKVFVLFPVPEIPMNIHKAIHPFSIFSQKPLVDLNKSSELSYYYKRNRFILGKLNTLEFNDQLTPIKPTEIYCDEKFCKAVIGNDALYFDDDHPSIAGARLLAKLFYFHTSN